MDCLPLNQDGDIKNLLTNLEKVSVMICFDNYSIIGNTYYRTEQRFLDMLNKDTIIDKQHIAEFVVVTRGLLTESNGKKKKMTTPCFISKNSIIFIGAFDETKSTTSENINAVKVYPWTEKQVASVEMVCENKYRLTGNMHVDPDTLPVRYIESQKNFLPMTDVRVVSLLAPSEISFKFLAVNRNHISMFQVNTPAAT